MANIYYVEKEAFRKFPPDTMHILIESYQLKEVLHKQKIQKHLEEGQEQFFGKNSNQVNLKTNQVFRLLKGPSRVKAQKIKLTIQETIHLHTSPDILNSADEKEGLNEQEEQNIYMTKNKLDSFLRGTVKVKPSIKAPYTFFFSL